MVRKTAIPCRDCEVIELPCSCKFVCLGEIAHQSISHTYKEGCCRYTKPKPKCFRCGEEVSDVFYHLKYGFCKQVELDGLREENARLREENRQWHISDMLGYIHSKIAETNRLLGFED